MWIWGTGRSEGRSEVFPAHSHQMRMSNGARQWPLPQLQYNLRRQQARPPPPPPAPDQLPPAGRQKRSKTKKPSPTPAPADGQPEEGGGNDEGADGNEASEQMFDVELPDDLFEAGPNAEVLFADSHDDQIVYGRFFLRQVWGLCAQAATRRRRDSLHTFRLKCGPSRDECEHCTHATKPDSEHPLPAPPLPDPLPGPSSGPLNAAPPTPHFICRRRGLARPTCCLSAAPLSTPR